MHLKKLGSTFLAVFFLIDFLSATDEGNGKTREKISFSPPSVPVNAFFYSYFQSPSDLVEELLVSQAKKESVDDVISKYDGIWAVEVPYTSAVEGDYGLVVKSKARHHAISTKLTKKVDFKHDQLVVQYEVKFQKPLECGGAYIKLLTDSPDLDLVNFNDKTPYTIMFGPDKCGSDHKIHLILRYKSPVTGKIEEKHAKPTKADIDRYFSDGKTHLYTLVINSDNLFEIYLDQTVINSGSLLTDLEPPINPPKEVDDPSDLKPSDWDEREKMQDLNAKKPDDWDETEPQFIDDESAVKPDGWLDDEPLLIPDPNSQKPSDWDDDMDGEYEIPKISNPKCKDAPGCGPWKKPKISNPRYKGKWMPPMVANPNYKGKWKPRRIANPEYFEDDNPYRNLQPISAIGLELWSMTEDIVFDNFIITHMKKEADAFAAATWLIKKDEERRVDPKAQSVVDAIQEATKDKPWIWVVVLFGFVLPLCLLVGYCCLKSGSKQSQAVLDVPKESDSKVDSDVDNSETRNNPQSGGKGDLESESSQDEIDEEEDIQKAVESESDAEEQEERKVTRRSAAKNE